MSGRKEHDKPQQKDGVQFAESGQKTMAEENGITDGKTERKKSKKERKEERQKNNKKEKKDLKLESQPVSSETKKNKKSRKQKDCLENEFEMNGNGHQNETEEETNVRKRKYKHVEGIYPTNCIFVSRLLSVPKRSIIYLTGIFKRS